MAAAEWAIPCSSTHAEVIPEHGTAPAARAAVAFLLTLLFVSHPLPPVRCMLLKVSTPVRVWRGTRACHVPGARRRVLPEPRHEADASAQRDVRP